MGWTTSAAIGRALAASYTSLAAHVVTSCCILKQRRLPVVELDRDRWAPLYPVRRLADFAVDPPVYRPLAGAWRGRRPVPAVCPYRTFMSRSRPRLNLCVRVVSERRSQVRPHEATCTLPQRNCGPMRKPEISMGFAGSTAAAVTLAEGTPNN